ncbi:MAG: zinc ribbon domain-containing protein [Clostridiaceae bacterium]
MSFSSRSSKRNHYKHGKHGSSHYQKKGIMGKLFNMIQSGSSSGSHYNNYRKQHSNTSMQNHPYSNQPSLNCTNCNSEIPAGAKFCLNCGEKVKTELFCPTCGEKMAPNAKFCPQCGNKLSR